MAAVSETNAYIGRQILEQPETEKNKEVLRRLFRNGYNPNQQIHIESRDFTNYRENLTSYAIHLKKYEFVKIIDDNGGRLPDKYVDYTEYTVLHEYEDGRNEEVQVINDDRKAFEKYKELINKHRKAREVHRRRKVLTKGIIKERTGSNIVGKQVTDFMGGKGKKTRKSTKKHVKKHSSRKPLTKRNKKK